MLNKSKAPLPSVLPRDSFFSYFSETGFSKPKMYVDKTEQIVQLIQDRGFFCLCRPRRFGKTLTISLIADIFSNGTQNFKDCAIAKNNLWQDDKYPVLFFSFGDFNKNNIEEFNFAFSFLIQKSVLNAGIDLSKEINDPLILLHTFFQQLDQPVVVLVDEYDTPLVSNIDTPELYKNIENKLSAFYSVFKIYEHKIRFMLLTGVNRVSNLSIFSGFNNIKDISFYPAYASIVGYTEQELLAYFYEPLLKIASYYNLDFDAFMEQLKARYNGYCFDKTLNEHVFNTWDINSLLTDDLDESTFLPKYWIKTASISNFIFKCFELNNKQFISFINQLITDLPEVILNEIELPQNFLSTPVYLFLFNAGYLTLSPANKNNITPSIYTEDKLYKLDFPNQTIRDFVLNNLISSLNSFAPNLSKGFKFDHDYFEELLNPLGSDLKRKEILSKMLVSSGAIAEDCFSKESHLRTLLIIMFKLAGFHVQFEVAKMKGRVDLMLIHKHVGFIIEIKVFKSDKLDTEQKKATFEDIAQASEQKKLEAFVQISKKEYHYVFPASCQEVYFGALVGDCSSGKITDFELKTQTELVSYLQEHSAIEL